MTSHAAHFVGRLSASRSSCLVRQRGIGRFAMMCTKTENKQLSVPAGYQLVKADIELVNPWQPVHTKEGAL